MFTEIGLTNQSKYAQCTMSGLINFKKFRTVLNSRNFLDSCPCSWLNIKCAAKHMFNSQKQRETRKMSAYIIISQFRTIMKHAFSLRVPFLYYADIFPFRGELFQCYKGKSFQRHLTQVFKMPIVHHFLIRTLALLR